MSALDIRYSMSLFMYGMSQNFGITIFYLSKNRSRTFKEFRNILCTYIAYALYISQESLILRYFIHFPHVLYVACEL